MHAWKEKISKCHCWYPSMTVNVVANIIDKSDELQELVNIGTELVENNMTNMFDKWKQAFEQGSPQGSPGSDIKLQAIEQILKIANQHGYTQEMHDDIQQHLFSMDPSVKSLALEQQMVSMPIVKEKCTCHLKDPGLIRTQGHPDTVVWEKYPEKWKPYTTSYALKDIDDSGLLLHLEPAQGMVKKYFNAAAQMNARTTWNAVGEKKYVDFSSGTHMAEKKQQRLYDKNFIDFTLSTHKNIVLCPNNFGEYFEFYKHNNVIADGSESVENLKYLSKTEVGDYVNIDKYSHTDQFRSDCSLWYRYHQERIKASLLKHATKKNWKYTVASTKLEIKKLQPDPPRTHEQRFKYWKYIKNTL